MKKFILVFLLLLAFPATAHAGLFDFVVLAVAVWFLGPTAFGWTAGQTAFTIAVMAYGQYKTMELARQQEEAQRRALESYNASLKDRTITNVATDTPHVTIYGRARVGSAIVAIFSSGARDEYQHLICIHAAHECDAIEEVYIAGKALGTLDGNGFPTSGDYLNSSTQYKTESTSGITYDLTYTPNTGTLIVSTVDTDGNQTQWPYTLIGNTVTVTGPSQAYTNSYYYTVTNPSVRIIKHLGSPTDPADTQLMAEVGAKWDSSRVLRGYCYTYVRLDLNQQEFQGGIPAIEMLIRGKKLYDPRQPLSGLLNPGSYDVTTPFITSFTRTTTATYVDGAGVLQTAAVDTPRFEGGKLLVEAAGTNLLLWSEDFGNAAWTKNGVTATSDTLTFSAANQSAYQAVSGLVGSTGIFTVKLSGTVGKKVNLYLSNGSATIGAGVQIILTAVPTIYSISANLVGAADSVCLIDNRSFYGIPVGDITMTVVCSSIQAETGLVATSYIPTTTAPGLRAADIATITNTIWSSNNALVEYDYLLGENCGVPFADIPSADVITAANVCDELITVGTLSNVPRYTFNGTVSSDQDQTKIIGQIAQSMSGGINATTWEMWAGKYVAPVLTIEQTDIVGAIGINPGLSDADIFNGVTARFISAENNYVPTDIKPYQNATYRAADGKDLFASMEFPFTDQTQRIHNLARIYVEDQRNSFTVKGTFSLKAWDVKIGQRIQFNASFFGFTNKIFRVVAKSYSYNGTVELTLKEDAASIWDLADAVVLDSTPNSDLPNPFFIDIPGAPTVTEELYETSGSSGVKSRVLITWTANESIRVTGYVVEYKSITAIDWTVLPLTTMNRILISDFQLGNFEFRLKAINSYFSVASQYSQVTRKEILGLTAQPSNVTNFNVIAISGRALGSWDLTGDLDVRIGGRVIIRHTPEISGGSWESSIILEEFNGNAANGNLPLLTGTYFAKFKDSSGNYSTTAASFLATEALVTGYTTTHTLAEHPSFTGSKTDLVAIDNLLKLNGVSLIDDMTPLIDDWSEIDTLGGIKPLGTYLFSTYMDFGSVVQRKIDVNIQTLSYDSSDLIDLWGFIDSVNAIDGAVINDTDATLYYRTTNDDPAGTPTYGAWAQFIVADVICRALQYKLELTSGNPTHQMEVSSLTARARQAV